MGTSTSKTSQVLDLPVYNKGYDLLKYLGWGMLKWKPTVLPSVFFRMTGWIFRCYLLLKGYLLWPESIMRIFFEPNQSRFLSCLKFVRLERCLRFRQFLSKASWNMKFEIWDFSQDDLTYLDISGCCHRIGFCAVTKPPQVRVVVPTARRRRQCVRSPGYVKRNSGHVQSFRLGGGKLVLVLVFVHCIFMRFQSFSPSVLMLMIFFHAAVPTKINLH